ncbi:MAG: D-TA family PLP-dependent enzyme [Verrucomicrobiales bacterium]
MTSPTSVANLPSPALIFDVNAIENNLNKMIAQVGGDTNRLRPHIKTHKCREILEWQLRLGISSVKCATIAEAELAADSGIPDILIAYPLIGQNALRLHQLARAFPKTKFATVVDSARGIEDLSSGPESLEVFIDLNCGMSRTGIRPGPELIQLSRSLLDAPNLTFAGLHAYDGHIHDPEITDRLRAFTAAMKELETCLTSFAAAGIEVAALVSGGSPTFMMHSASAMSSGIPWQSSPGTTVLWDAGYAEAFTDLDFEPAAFLFTRVVSRPSDTLACLDLGHKAVSSENPIDNRVRFPNHSELVFRSQSEEHLVVEVADTDSLTVGTELIGVPWHVCPTVALYDEAWIVRNGEITGETWSIEARRRRINV